MSISQFQIPRKNDYSVDEKKCVPCDILEGGRTAFELRQHKYTVVMHGIIDSKNFSIREIVEFAISHKLIKRTETYTNISERDSNFWHNK